MATAPAINQYGLQDEGEPYEDLLSILSKYLDERGDSTSFLIEDDTRIIL